MARYGKIGPLPKSVPLRARVADAKFRTVHAAGAIARGARVDLAPLRAEVQALEDEARARGLMAEGTPQSAMADHPETRPVPSAAPGSARTPQRIPD